MFLLQGNIKFNLNDDVVVIVNKNELNSVAQLLSINSSELNTALSHRVIAAGGEVMQKTHTLNEAEYGRDALAKVCLFLFIFLN